MGLSINWLSVPLPEATPSSSEVPRTPERLSSTLALVPTSTRSHMLSQRVASSRRHVDVGAPEVSRSKHNYTGDMGVKKFGLAIEISLETIQTSFGVFMASMAWNAGLLGMNKKNGEAQFNELLRTEN